MTPKELAEHGAPQELEWQFDALDFGAVDRWLDAQVARPNGPVAGLRLSRAPRAQRIVDRYFDTVDWRIGRGGFVLRERRKAGRVELTMKNLVESDEGFRHRLEITVPGALPILAGESDGGDLAWRVRALIGNARLVPIVEVVTRRQTIELMDDSGALGELTYDESALSPPGTARKLRLRRVELEVPPAALESATALIEPMRAACALTPARLSKFEAGLLAAGLAIPGPPELGPTSVEATSTMGELAFASLRRDASAMVEHEPGTRLGDDIEELHQMRVATRRLRAALALFAEALPVRAQALRAEIGWLAGALGAVRDLDVQLEQARAWRADARSEEAAGLDELLERLHLERTAARAELLATLDSRRYQRFVTGLTSMLEAGVPRRSALARTPAAVALPGLIEQHQAAARRAARRAKRSGVADDFHRLRIKTKRLRYALDFSVELFGTPARRYAKTLAALQGRLGSMQDAEVGAERLRRLALVGAAEGALSSGAIFTMGGLAERYRRSQAELLHELPSEVDTISDRSWDRLVRAMERSRRIGLTQVELRRAPVVARVAVVRGAKPDASPGPVAAEPSVSPSSPLVGFSRLAQDAHHASPGQ